MGENMANLESFLASGRTGRILVPVDFSPKVELTLPRAVALAKLSQSSILLLHVIDAVTVSYTHLDAQSGGHLYDRAPRRESNLFP